MSCLAAIRVKIMKLTLFVLTLVQASLVLADESFRVILPRRLSPMWRLC